MHVAKRLHEFTAYICILSSAFWFTWNSNACSCLDISPSPAAWWPGKLQKNTKFQRRASGLVFLNEDTLVSMQQTTQRIQICRCKVSFLLLLYHLRRYRRPRIFGDVMYFFDPWDSCPKYVISIQYMHTSSARTSRGRKFPKGKELYSTERICL